MAITSSRLAARAVLAVAGIALASRAPARGGVRRLAHGGVRGGKRDRRHPSAPGDLVVFPAGVGTPNASMVSFLAGRTRANNAQILLSADGTGRAAIQNSSGGTLDLLIDVTGYYE